MEKNPAEALKNIVVASPLGTGEVFPVEEDEETKKSQVVEREEKKNQECEVWMIHYEDHDFTISTYLCSIKL